MNSDDTKTAIQIEPGIYRRRNPRTGKLSPILWIRHEEPGRPGGVFHSAKTTNITEARTALARARVLVADGGSTPLARLTVAELLDRLVADYIRNNRASLPTLRADVGFVKAEIGTLRARDVTTAVIERLQEKWQTTPRKPSSPTGPPGPPVTNRTINSRCERITAAFGLAVKAGTLRMVPHVPKLDTSDAILGRYLEAHEQVLLMEYLPDYAANFFTFALQYATRKGQLQHIRREWVDPVRRVIVWPPRRTKQRRVHQLPLDGKGWEIVAALLAEERPWCPYLFHGLRCSAVRRQKMGKHGCIGTLRDVWATACKRAGLPVGRKLGGPIFHNTRNTAVTDLLAGGMPEAEAMKIGGWQTTGMIRHYDLGNIEALRARVEASRKALAALSERCNENATELPAPERILRLVASKRQHEPSA